IFTAGPYANQPAVMTPEDAERLVTAEKNAGYDVIKIHGDLTREAFERLVSEGHRKGIEVVGHAPRNLPFDAVLSAGMRSVVHGEELVYTHFKAPADRSSERIDALGSRMRDRGVWLTPTLAMQRSLTQQWARPGEIDAMMAKDPAAKFLTFDIR